MNLWTLKDLKVTFIFTKLADVPDLYNQYSSTANPFLSSTMDLFPNSTLKQSNAIDDSGDFGGSFGSGDNMEEYEQHTGSFGEGWEINAQTN